MVVGSKRYVLGWGGHFFDAAIRSRRTREDLHQDAMETPLALRKCHVYGSSNNQIKQFYIQKMVDWMLHVSCAHTICLVTPTVFS
jgi:hypothetical protein